MPKPKTTTERFGKATFFLQPGFSWLKSGRSFDLSQISVLGWGRCSVLSFFERNRQENTFAATQQRKIIS